MNNFEIKQKTIIILIFFTFVFFLIISIFTRSINWPFIKYDMFITVRSKSHPIMRLLGTTSDGRIVEIDTAKLFKVAATPNIILHRFYKLKLENQNLYLSKLNELKTKFNSANEKTPIESINLVLDIIQIKANETNIE